MTGHAAIDAALSAIEPGQKIRFLVYRNGRHFMALPVRRHAALLTLRLYQPQRSKAIFAAFGLRGLAATGLHRVFLPKLRGSVRQVELTPEFPQCVHGTAGIMLGSPEHPVPRAILSYQTENGWEVAKLSFGEPGRKVIEGEFSALASLPTGTPGVPLTLGVHHGLDFSLLRMPYFRGTPLCQQKMMRALDLLESWVGSQPSQPAAEFPEWPAIHEALVTSDAGRRALERLAAIRLRPVIRHGDFARWNLLELRDGSCMAIDWEWAHRAGMPGIDVVHLFAQDARLVHQLPPAAIVRVVERALSGPRCRGYLESCGWGANPRDVLLASIAFTVGTKQQSNEEVLAAALQQ
jgi:hypothetical protein